MDFLAADLPPLPPSGEETISFAPGSQDAQEDPPQKLGAPEYPRTAIGETFEED